MTILLPILLFIIGLFAIIAGVALMSIPLSLIVGGTLLVIVALGIGFFAVVGAGALQKGGTEGE